MLQSISDVWEAIAEFLTGLFPSIQALFYDPTANSGAGGLTFIGILSLITCSIAIVLLIFNLVRSFLVARG